jgi:hypothetical protein
MLKRNCLKSVETHSRYRIKYEATTDLGNILEIYISKVEHEKKYKSDLMNIWVKKGYMKEFLDSHIHAEVYYRTHNGDLCYRPYDLNPTMNSYNDTNWENIIEYNEENIEKLITMILEALPLYEKKVAIEGYQEYTELTAKAEELKEDIAKTENKEQRLHYSTALKKIENKLSYRADEYKEIIRTYNELIKTGDIENTVFKFLAREGNGPYQYYFIRSNNIKSAREKLLNTFNSIVHIEDEEVLSSIEVNRLIKNDNKVY